MQTLQKLFGIADIDLRERLEGTDPEERINNAVKLYLAQLEGVFSKGDNKGFAASYQIISLDGKKKYHLVFACSHKKAATLASNIVNSIEETFQHEKEEYQELQTGQMSLFSEITEKQIFKEKVRKLKLAILVLPKNVPLTREELHYELMIQDKSWFGKIGRTHLTQALKELLQESRIKSNGTPGKDETIFTILE